MPGYPRGLVQIVNVRGLRPDRCYRLELLTRTRARLDSAWQHAASAFVDTLPERLPAGSWESAFRIMVGSCFARAQDGGQTTRAFEQLWADPAERPALKFLVGDQVYLDVGLPIFRRMSTDQIRARVLNHYGQAWRALAGMLERGGTWMLPDDHEYHNNFPSVSGVLNPYLRISERYRAAWTKVARAAVRNIQQTTKVRLLTIGDDLSFCVLDLRSGRRARDQGFADPESFAAVRQWLRGLTGPGVLVISQLLMRDGGRRTDNNLACFRGQYSALVEAIAACGHDVVVLAGDVHFSRICDTTFASGKRLIEVASSPMSNMDKFRALLTARVPDRKPASFPPIAIDGVAPALVNYRRQISTHRRNWTYPRARSTENFVTVGFLRGCGGVRMRVKAWRLSAGPCAGSLPALDYEYDYVIS